MADERDEKSRALQPLPAAPPVRIAPSIAAARQGEMVLLDKRGNVLGPARRRWITVRSWGLLGGVVALNGVVYGTLFSPLAGVVAGAASLAWIGFRLRNWPAYRAAIALVAAGRFDEAHAALSALEARALPPACRVHAQVTLAALDGLLGRPQAALDRLEQPGPADSRVLIHRVRVAAVRAESFAQLGRFAEARAQRDVLAAAPRSEMVELLQQSVELTLAFEADRPDDLPATEVLHEWARAALLRSKFGEVLVSLAWAFHRRGDDDMARHLLAEAPARMPTTTLTRAQPRLHAWAQEHIAAWGIDVAASD